MSDARKKADEIRAAYAKRGINLSDENFEEMVQHLDFVGLPDTPGLNMRRYSQDGHSWNGRPYVSVDPRRF